MADDPAVCASTRRLGLDGAEFATGEIPAWDAPSRRFVPVAPSTDAGTDSDRAEHRADIAQIKHALRTIIDLLEDKKVRI